jgi:ribosomal protein L11 methyltransferase
MWKELIFVVAEGEVDGWTDALLQCGAASVQAEDADEGTPDEQALFGEPGEPVAAAAWSRTRLSAMIEASEDADALMGCAAMQCGLTLPARRALRDVEELDWVRVTQAQFEPIPIGKRLLVTPSWHPAQPDEQRKAIVLDPGLAFGTGSHPTTRMCLEWLDEHLEPETRVIDYGCGSGILAIAAARLGAASVTAIDIDPQALESTLSNAAVNRVSLDVQAASNRTPPRADVVLANILANPLRILAPALCALVRPGGWLVLAGLLERQADEIAACYPDVELRAWRSLDGWTCLAGRARS